MLFKKYRIKNYTFEEFKSEFTKEDISLADKMINQIKNNKVMYTKLVVITALLLHFNMNFVFANKIGTSLDATFSQLITLLMKFAKWGCLGLGLKKTIEEMLVGANFKQASTAGIQYWLAYIFIQFYPKLFDMINI